MSSPAAEANTSGVSSNGNNGVSGWRNRSPSVAVAAGAIGVYSATLLGLLIWRLRCRRRAAAASAVTTSVATPSTPSMTPSSTSSSNNTTSTTTAADASATAMDIPSSDATHGTNSGSRLPKPPTAATAGATVRTRVRAREEIDDDEQKQGFLSNTAVFTRQTISPLGTDNLGTHFPTVLADIH
jgi:cytoskeletal protein RodZ